MFGTSAAVRQQCRRGPASFNVHPHLLQHACGFKLANEGHDTLGATALLGHKTSSIRSLQRLCGRELEESVRERARPLLPRRGPWRSISDS